MSEDLVAFLNARIAEDEATARACPAGKTWTQVDPERSPGRIEDEHGDPVVYDEGAPSEPEATHIARHDPARVLREVEAKRKILAEVVPDIMDMDQQIIGEWGNSRDKPEAHFPLLKIMASVYRDHQDYDPSWTL